MDADIREFTGTQNQNRLTRSGLLKKLKRVRKFTETLTDPLETEDFVIQVAEHASPVKWHLAHTSWFFEAFLLEKATPDYETAHPRYGYLFNSYYLQTGEPHCRNKRGNLSRPTVKEVFGYRRYVDDHLEQFIENSSDEVFGEWASVVEIGINHEQQHQELLLTDLKYMLGQNPLYPAYINREISPAKPAPPLSWTGFDEGVRQVGHPGGSFGYDNEFPRHKTYIHKFELANRLVTNGEYLDFIKSDGYSNPEWWLDEGYSTVIEEEWEAPLYWIKQNGEWFTFTLNGIKKPDLNEPVTHISYYEADAYARWAGLRLPTEQEWEIAAEELPVEGNFVDEQRYHPSGADPEQTELQQMFGNVWQWTRSSYAAYPGYRRFPGKLGEYNGKFMCNQYVLRGGSCATSKSHFRKTYRNFFYAGERWQFMGIRLAR